MLGSRISTIAFPVLVLNINRSPFIAGLVTCAGIAPSLLAYIPVGALVDRWDPWFVMLASEVMRGLAVVWVVFYLWASSWHVSIYVLMLYMIIEEILEIFWMLADRRFMSRLLERDKRDNNKLDLANCQASVEVRAHAAILAGRPIGPWLFTVTSYAPFLADFVSFIASIGTLLMIGPRADPEGTAETTAKRLLRSEIVAGFQWLKGDLRASTTMVLMSFTTLIAQALIMMFLVEAHDNKLSAVAIGIVLAASGVGGAFGSAIAKRLPKPIRRFWLQIQLVAWGAALAFLALSGVRLAWCIAIVMLILGFAGSIGNIQFGIYLVKKLKNGMLGRVTSIGQVMTIAAFGIGPLLGGVFIQNFGIQVAVEIFLGLVTVMALASFCIPRISRLTTERDPDVPDNSAEETSSTVPELAIGLTGSPVSGRSGVNC